MTPLCNLGWHRISLNVRWNRGYYFSRCERCGRDLIRTIYGRWHEPRGYRVVWQANAPSCPNPPPPSSGRRPSLPIQHVLDRLKYDHEGVAQRTSTTLESGSLEASASGAGEGQPGEARRTDLLEQHHGTSSGGLQQPEPVLEPPAAIVQDQQRGSHADAGDHVPVASQVPGEAEGLPGDRGEPTWPGRTPMQVSRPAATVPAEQAPPGPLPGPPSAAKSPSGTDPVSATEQPPDSAFSATSHAQDFMAGDEGESAWESLLNFPNPALAHKTAGPFGQAARRSGPARFDGLLGQVTRLAASARRNGPNRLRRFVRLNLKGAEIPPATATLAGLAGGAAVSILAGVFAISLLLARGSEHGTSSVPAINNLSPAVATTGYVSASLLNCRTAPAREAGVARRLGRGDEIDILANDSGWASIGIRRRQCWVQARYISLVRPLKAQ